MYQVDSDACFSGKVNNSSLIGLEYTQILKPGIILTLSALLDDKTINASGHKLGLGLVFQAEMSIVLILKYSAA
jgi:voltage-dependent anion channel protein 1